MFMFYYQDDYMQLTIKSPNTFKAGTIIEECRTFNVCNGIAPYMQIVDNDFILGFFPFSGIGILPGSYSSFPGFREI